MVGTNEKWSSARKNLPRSTTADLITISLNANLNSCRTIFYAILEKPNELEEHLEKKWLLLVAAERSTSDSTAQTFSINFLARGPVGPPCKAADFLPRH